MPKIKKAMYKEAQKKEYLSYIEDDSTAVTMLNYFKRVAEMEWYLNKDISEMNTNEILATILNLNIRSITYRYHIISFLSGYTEWAISLGKINQDNQFKHIKAENINSENAVRMQMLKSPAHLLEIIETVFPDDYFYPVRADRDILIMLLLYLGMVPEELQLLKKNSIDLINNTIISPINENVSYYVDEEIMSFDKIKSLWNKCSEMTFVERSGSKGRKRVVHCSLKDNDYLFRPKTGYSEKENLRIQQFAQMVTNIFKSYSEISGNITYIGVMRVIRSGLFYRLYLLEKNGEELTNDVILKFANARNVKSMSLYNKGRMLYKDYIEWKSAFGY